MQSKKIVSVFINQSRDFSPCGAISGSAFQAIQDTPRGVFSNHIFFLQEHALTIISLYSQFSFQSKHGLSSPYNFFVPRDNSHISVPLSLLYKLAEKQFLVSLHAVWQSICWAKIVLNNPQVSLLLNSRENEAPEHCCACSLGITVNKQTRRNAFVDTPCKWSFIAEPRKSVRHVFDSL